MNEFLVEQVWAHRWKPTFQRQPYYRTCAWCRKPIEPGTERACNEVAPAHGLQVHLPCLRELLEVAK